MNEITTIPTALNLRPVMKFEEYQHIEALGHDEVEGIENGLCYIFPKIDGANASVWTALGNGTGDQFSAGSRRRQISIDNDNQGFAKYIDQHSGIKRLLQYGYFRLFGEWLVPHTLKDYRDDAWRKFYVFDVMNHKGQYFTYDEYKPMLDFYGIDYITPLEVINRPTQNDFMRLLDKNTFLMKDGFIGEGIVIKNYDFVNKFGRVTWAKIVRNEFKDKHKKENRTQIIERSNLEYEIAQKYLTLPMVEKIIANIILDGNWNKRFIPRLLQTAYYDLIRECSWDIVKDHKNPTINFRVLQSFVNGRVKELKPELF